MSLWTAQEAAEATGGEARGNWACNGVSIDTRTLAPGDLFVALKDVRDGHDFVAQALAHGAGAALVSHVPTIPPPSDLQTTASAADFVLQVLCLVRMKVSISSISTPSDATNTWTPGSSTAATKSTYHSDSGPVWLSWPSSVGIADESETKLSSPPCPTEGGTPLDAIRLRRSSKYCASARASTTTAAARRCSRSCAVAAHAMRRRKT